MDVLAGSAVPVNCGADGSTVTNRGPATLYYRDEEPVNASANDGLLLTGGQVTLYGTAFLWVAAERAAVEIRPLPSVAAEGSGVPAGGTTGQVLTKQSDSDGDATWDDGTPGPSGNDGQDAEPSSARLIDMVTRTSDLTGITQLLAAPLDITGFTLTIPAQDVTWWIKFWTAGALNNSAGNQCGIRIVETTGGASIDLGIVSNHSNVANQGRALVYERPFDAFAGSSRTFKAQAWVGPGGSGTLSTGLTAGASPILFYAYSLS